MTKWGSGDGNAPFPDAGIGAEALGHTYVVDRGNDRIEKFDSNGKLIVGSPGNGHSNKISDVNVGLVVKVYVSDNGNKNVRRIPRGSYWAFCASYLKTMTFLVSAK